MTNPPPKQGPPRGNTVPPATPGSAHSAKDTTLPTTPLPTPSGGYQGRFLSRTPHLPSSPFPVRTPRTPGGAGLSTCTDDRNLYGAVMVHTAKCTECDQRNKKTMLRCPGCTFQLCEPCHEKRVKRGKGLRHGNMATPGATKGAATPTTISRTVRKKPFASTPSGQVTKRRSDEAKDENEGDMDNAPSTKKSTSKKGSAKKKRRTEDSETEDSSEDNFQPDDMTPTPSKRRRGELTFAESALATAGRTPPTTRASRKSIPQEAVSLSAPPNVVDPRASVGHRLSEIHNPLYQHAVQGYDEPLLGRRVPVMSNPAANIPAIIKRGGQPRPSVNDIRQNIQDKVREQMQKAKGPGFAYEESTSDMAVHRVSCGTGTDLQKANVTESDAEKEAYLCTVRAFVAAEAAKYQNNVTMDEDENKAVLHAMEGASLVWAKKTYTKLDGATQQQVQPGLKLRLDRINAEYLVELKRVVEVHAARMLQELDVG